MRNESAKGRGAAWPYATLLFAGYFGADSPGGRAFRRRVWTAALALPVVGFLSRMPGLREIPAPIWALTLPGIVAAVVWACVRYLAELDELSRLIQLESLAFSYGVLMTLAALWCALDQAGLPVVRSMSGYWIFVFLMLAEPLRGIVLVIQARRRR